eukprot:GHRR01018922.1.p2 GENE.GHRR01018922.1~~GHRR01018922.1.p2  ORF type:complete len:117 (-),score=19.22 GHRR01018922.1:1597-1947(-)
MCLKQSAISPAVNIRQAHIRASAGHSIVLMMSEEQVTQRTLAKRKTHMLSINRTACPIAMAACGSYDCGVYSHKQKQHQSLCCSAADNGPLYIYMNQTRASPADFTFPIHIKYNLL